MASQNPGDKSTELSFRTQDLLEEGSQDSDDDDDDDDDDEADDDLSEQMSYIDGTAYNDDMNALGPFSDDEQDEAVEILLFDGEDDGDADGADDAAQVSDDDEVSEDDETQRSEDIAADEFAADEFAADDFAADDFAAEDAGEDDRPQDYQSHAQVTLQDLIEVYSARNQVSFDQYERSLRQLHTKWETVLEQAIFDHEQNLDSADQERQEMELHIEELRQAHENELEASKGVVMEQSQKIILEEMKANADFELKSEGTTEIAVQKAVEETQREMNEDFEIALAGMQTAQEGMQTRYEKLVKETEIRVRDEVESSIKTGYESKMESFKETYEDMKSQLLDQTMQIQALEMNSTESPETGALIASLENEVQVLRKSIEEANARHQQQVEQTNSDIEKEKQVYAQAKKVADRTISAFKAQYDDVKKQVIGMAIDLEALEIDSGSKASEIEQLSITIETRETAIDELGAEINTKNSEIDRLGTEIETKTTIIVQLGAELESKSNEFSSIINTKDSSISELSYDIEAKEQLLTSKDEQIQELGAEIKTLLEASASEIKVLGEQLAAKMTMIEHLNAEIETKNDGIKQLIEEMDTIDTVVLSRDTEVTSKLEILKADIDAKNNMIDTKDSTIKDLGAIIAAKECVIQTKETEIRTLEQKIKAQVKSKHKEEIKSLMDIEKQKAVSAQHLYDEQVQYLQEKYDAVIQKLHKKVGEESTDSTSRVDDMIRKHEESVAAAESRFTDTLEDLKTNHKAEMEELKESHRIEKDELKGIIKLIRNEKEAMENAHVVVVNEYLETISGLKRDHQTAIERLEEEHNHEAAQGLRLIDQLRVEKDSLMASTRSANGSPSSSKRSAKRKNSSADTQISKIVIEGAPLDAQLHVLDGKRGDIPQNKENAEIQSLASAGRTTVTSRSGSRGIDTLASPEKNRPTKNGNVLIDLSPLTMASPLAKQRKSMASQASTPSRTLSRTPRQIPKTVGPRRKTHESHSIAPRSVPARTSRSVRMSVMPEESASKHLAVRKSSSTASHKVSSSRSIASQEKSTKRLSTHGSRTGSYIRNSSSKSSIAKPPSTPLRMAHSDLESVQMRSREGLFSSVNPDIRLLVLTVPLTDRMKKMARALQIEIVDNPLIATHVIAGDAENHLRRTANLMAALCVTPNILRAEWLEDCYKHKVIISPSHHTLLNDYIAEKAYSFSMKQTIKEGNERRKYGGLFNRWQILVCEGVAGNKAPKEAALRLMIEAAGGTWLDASLVPVPLEEDPTHVIVITSDPATPEQEADVKAKTAAESGAGFFTTSWLFDSLMHQKMFGVKRGLGR